jgi:hypothetical protein
MAGLKTSYNRVDIASMPTEGETTTGENEAESNEGGSNPNGPAMEKDES